MAIKLDKDRYGIQQFLLRDWKDLYDEAMKRDGWIFRGEQANWPSGLTTSLERACITVDTNLDRASQRESELIRQFCRRFHHYSAHVPDKSDDLEWLSWMRHYGAPTRLLDWTYSIYVAAYVALKAEPKPNHDECENWQKVRVIWAIDSDWCREKAEKLAKRGGVGKKLLKYFADQITDEDADKFRRIFMRDQEPRRKKAIPLVLPINPFKLNERLSVQKGLFLCPGSVTKKFMENLKALGKSEGHCKKFILFGISSNPLPAKDFREKRLEALRELYHMNISHDTLFPGLEGFAKSLAVYHPVTWKTINF